jgi:hypothetical protein
MRRRSTGCSSVPVPIRSVETSTHTGLRDRALLGVLARLGPVSKVNLGRLCAVTPRTCCKEGPFDAADFPSAASVRCIQGTRQIGVVFR